MAPKIKNTICMYVIYRYDKILDSKYNRCPKEENICRNNPKVNWWTHYYRGLARNTHNYDTFTSFESELDCIVSDYHIKEYGNTNTWNCSFECKVN